MNKPLLLVLLREYGVKESIILIMKFCSKPGILKMGCWWTGH